MDNLDRRPPNAWPLSRERRRRLYRFGRNLPHRSPAVSAC